MDHLEGFRPAQRWREEKAEEIFPTASSWEWFRRTHVDTLKESGQFIPGRGRRGDLVGPNIGIIVLGILRKEAGVPA